MTYSEFVSTSRRWIQFNGGEVFMRLDRKIALAFIGSLALGTLLPIETSVAQAPGKKSFSAKCVNESAWHGGAGGARNGYATLTPCNQEEPADILALTCSGPSQQLTGRLDYIAPSQSTGKVRFVIVVDGKHHRLKGTVNNIGMYETLDFSLAKSHPLIEQLTSGSKGRLLIGRKTRDIHLKGAGKAIETMLQGCGLSNATKTVDARGKPVETFEPASSVVKPIGWSPVPLRRRYKHPSCRSSHRQLTAKLPAFQLIVPDKDVVPGQPVEIKWRAEPGLFKGKRNIYLYVDIPHDLDVADGNFSVNRWEEPNSINRSLFRLTQPNSRSMKRLLVHIAGKPFASEKLVDNPSGKIVLRPTQAGRLTVNAGLIAASSEHPTSALKNLCDGTALTKPSVHMIAVKTAPKKLEVAQACHIRGEGDQTVGPDVRVNVNAAQRKTLRVGDALDVHWSVRAKIERSCTNPLYLVLSTASSLRFAGDGFIALAPGAKGPYGIAHESDKTRVFVPLHIGDVARSGVVQAKFYGAGRFDIVAKLIEVPRLTQFPKNRADFDGTRPVVATLGDSGPVRVNVSAGVPKVVVQDRAMTSTPKSKIYADSGDFILEIFDGYYRVLDANSGELVIQRDGTKPNFSPTARFVHALREDRTKLEIVDLHAGIVAHEFDSGYGTGEIYGGNTVDTIAWGHADSFVIIAANINDGHFLNTLSDRKPTVVSPSNYKIGIAETVELHLDLELLTLATRGTGYGYSSNVFGEPVYYSLLEAQSQSDLYAFDKNGNQIEGRPDKFQRRYGIFGSTWPQFSRTTRRWQLGNDVRIDYSSFCSSCPSGRDIIDASTLRRTLRSEIPDYLKGRKRNQWVADTIKEARQLLPLFIRHAARKPDSKKSASLPPAAGKEGQSIQWRGWSRIKLGDVASAESRALKRIQEFADFDISSNYPSTTAGAMRQWNVRRKKSVVLETGRDRALERAVFRHLNSPRFQTSLKQWLYGEAIQDGDVGTYGCEAGSPEIGNIVSLSRVINRTAWRVGDDRYWLIQQDCVRGVGITDGQLGLMIQHGSDQPEFIPFHLELGLDSRKLAKGWMTEDSVLIIAAPNRTLIVYDTRQKKQLALIKDARDADVVTGTYMTSDRSKLLQINANGSALLYSIKTGERLLNGYYVDDEVVFYRDDGSYDATPEGGHFVYLKFPGVRGYHTFDQFKAQLHVPGLIQKVLAGENVAGRAVGVPPRLAATISDPTGARIAGTFQVSSNSQVEKIQIYQDGVLTDTIAKNVSDGPNAFDVDRIPGSRWISLLAIDKEGLASQPVGRDLGADPRGPSRILSLSIGIDQYKDARLNLSGATRDAQTIAQAFKSQIPNGRSMDSTMLLDERATRTAILAGFKTAVSKPGIGDTLVVSYAGHGVRGTDGTFYLSTHETRIDDLPGTAIAWREIAAILKRSKARIVLLLDACHSGAAGTSFFATNDQAASELLAGVPANIVVFAAAKGREFSFEAPGGKGGIFSLAVADVISGEREAHDLNRNGAIEISELYIGVKRKVVEGGRTIRKQHARDNGLEAALTQTPWITRNQMVGDFALF